MGWVPTKLKHRHQEILRLTVLGWSATQIADHLSLNRLTVYCILRSPLAQAELARLQEAANNNVCDVASRTERPATFKERLSEASLIAVDVNETFMKDATLDKKLRSRIAAHFITSQLRQEDDTNREGGMREILRKLDRMEQGVVVLPAGDTVAVTNNGNNSGA